MSRALLLYLTAAPLSLLLHLRSPLPPDDSFRGTLTLLPLVVAGLLHVGRRLSAATWRSASIPGAGFEAVALAALLLLTLARDHLGLGGATKMVDRSLAAAYLLLLVCHLVRLAPALRRSLGSTLPARPAWPFFALPLICYLAILPWSASHHPPSGDEPYYLLQTHSLAYDFDTDLADNYAREDSLQFMDRSLEPQPGDPVGPEGQLYSRHNLLLPLLLAPAYRLLGREGALAVMAAFAALLCWSTLALARCYEPARPGSVLLAWATLAFSAPLVFYSHQIWIEVPAAILTVVALEGIYRLRTAEGLGARHLLGIALPIILLPLFKIRLFAISGALLLLAFVRCGRRARRQLAGLLGLVLALAAAVVVYNQTMFANPLKYHSRDIIGVYASFSPLRYLEGLFGIFFDCAFGLFAYGSLWLLLLPAAVLLIRRRHRLLTDLVVVFAPYLILLGPRGEWFGGWSPPFRYGVAMLPLLALALVPLFAERRRSGARVLLGALTVLTLTATLLWVIQPGWVYNLAHGRSHVLDYASTRLGADVGRFLPSSVRPRPATWIWPPAALLLLTGLWWLPGRIRREAIGAGVTGVLLAAAMLPVAATRLPTRVVEFEDTWVEKSGGSLFPERWVTNRPRYRGGWALAPGDEISAPLVTGGERATLTIDYLKPDEDRWPAGLTVRAGEREVAHPTLSHRDGWTTLVVRSVSWERGEPLVLTLRAESGDDARSHVILDRARVTWD